MNELGKDSTAYGLHNLPSGGITGVANKCTNKTVSERLTWTLVNQYSQRYVCPRNTTKTFTSIIKQRLIENLRTYVNNVSTLNIMFGPLGNQPCSVVHGCPCLVLKSKLTYVRFKEVKLNVTDEICEQSINTKYSFKFKKT